MKSRIFLIPRHLRAKVNFAFRPGFPHDRRCDLLFSISSCGIRAIIGIQLIRRRVTRRLLFCVFWAKMAAIAGKWDQIKDTAGNEKKGTCMNIYPMGPCAVSACPPLLRHEHDPRATQDPCAATRTCLLRLVPPLIPGWPRANASCSAPFAASWMLKIQRAGTSAAAPAAAPSTSPTAKADMLRSAGAYPPPSRSRMKASTVPFSVSSRSMSRLGPLLPGRRWSAERPGSRCSARARAPLRASGRCPRARRNRYRRGMHGSGAGACVRAW
jgi:hypothetical protein